ncbi:MFS transporter [Pseudonocardia acidicola]|uniref:MFS transporter n=1 Tax=Pseudonocardia acidicola TaxID=2724939 RepID=A0ABX1SCT0_9PSEU|nr:MFS transporter [Pseudonocardia acidicola]NMH98337.1 MFS transporter [Pseudonocardia acidicola]
MGDAATGPVRPAVLRPGGLRRVLVVLCVTEVVSWGVLYYAFPVLTPSIAADTGWSPSALTAAFSAALVVAGLVGIPVGRALDRRGPRAVMTAGSLLAVPAVLGIATARSVWWFLGAWLLAGVAMAGVLYQPAFAALTRWWAPRQVVALTGLTLVAGLSSTVFAPLTAALIARLDWRATYLVLAVVLAVLTIPLHLFGLRGPWPPVATDHPYAHLDGPGSVARSRPFVLLTVAMTLAAFAVYAVLINLVPLLLGRGLDIGVAALALGLGGVGQVAGRLFYGRLADGTTVRARTGLIIGGCAATTGLLAVVPGPAALLVIISIVVGSARGVFTLLQATAVSERWGAAHYGRLNGLLGAPGMLATAIAPWAGSALAAGLGGYPAVFVLLAGVAAVAALLAVTGATPHRAGG